MGKTILGTMAGGAADCQFWERVLAQECRLWELRYVLLSYYKAKIQKKKKKKITFTVTNLLSL